MKSLSFVVAASFALSAPVGAAGISSCGIDSRYDVSLDRAGLIFEQAKAIPARIEMRKGQLLVDGRELKLNAADRARLAEYEATLRALVPQGKAIARDAVDIAFTAVSEVVASLAGEAGQSSVRSRMNEIRARIRDGIDDAFEDKPWRQTDFENLVESTVKELLPVIAAEVAGRAVSIALSGDAEAAARLESAAEKLQHDIEKRISTQTQQLAARVATLCPMIAQLDRIESDLDVRLDGGARIDLIGFERD
ncbi:YggN family protein [Tahibacter amnicola]|uniref:YggN family protein n=1 Tax=Tahibacter amnicola TaxID=2976241 RepID=A0ABY6BD55_9GAMM|nr:YggN family protein [Tahibacter amnicola]UXI67971.1 YggN family protein [Tahibacter amnicola]